MIGGSGSGSSSGETIDSGWEMVPVVPNPWRRLEPWLLVKTRQEAHRFELVHPGIRSNDNLWVGHDKLRIVAGSKVSAIFPVVQSELDMEHMSKKIQKGRVEVVIPKQKK